MRHPNLDIIPTFEQRYEDWAEKKIGVEAKLKTPAIDAYGFKNEEEMRRFLTNFMLATETEIHQYLTDGMEFGIVLTIMEDRRKKGQDMQECYSLFFNEGTYSDNLYDISKHKTIASACALICDILAVDNGFQ